MTDWNRGVSHATLPPNVTTDPGHASGTGYGESRGLGGGKFQGCVGGRVYPVTQIPYEPTTEKRFKPEHVRSNAHPVARDDGTYYASLTQAAEDNGVPTHHISRAIELGYMCAGHRWQYWCPDEAS